MGFHVSLGECRVFRLEVEFRVWLWSSDLGALGLHFSALLLSTA